MPKMTKAEADLEIRSNVALQRARVIMEYPCLNSQKNQRWNADTPLITEESLQSKLLPIRKLWTTVAYFPFPEASEHSIKLPITPVISEEQNGSLEFFKGIPSLHLTMWNRNTKGRPDFQNYAYNLCLGIDRKLRGGYAWEACRDTSPKINNNFCPHPDHPLHKSARRHFFDGDISCKPNNLPVLAVYDRSKSLALKERDELVTLILTQALVKRMPLVTTELCVAAKECLSLYPLEAWEYSTEETLADFLWSGKYDQKISSLITEFKAWCISNKYIYPVWAIDSECIKKVQQSHFYAIVLNAVAVYQHNYIPSDKHDLKHLSPLPLEEEVRLLRCLPDKKRFVWERGHTRSTLRTSNKVKRYLQIRDETIEVKTFAHAYSGERINISL